MSGFNPYPKNPFAQAMGAKGGESQPKPPVEAPDTISSRAFAKLLDLVSEGEIVGLVDGARSIFLDETPLQSGEGFNFGGVQWDSRTGSLYQDYIKGFPNAENEIGINFELKRAQPYVRAITKLELSAVRVRMAFARLQSRDSKGNTNGATVQYNIELQTDGGAWVLQDAVTISAKVSNKYERTHRVNLPEARVGWTIRVTRITPDSTSDMLINPSVVEAIVEVIDAKFACPNSALIATQFDAQSFSGIPRRTFHIKGRIIRVPSNYDAESRTYSGLWDGTFKPAYTNNPAWVYYDLLLHKRYGLGDRVSESQVDKWALYRIAQHCDQMVDDGKGGLEPRFTCNLYLQERAAALKVMQDLASIFRGISYWGAGQVFTSSDMPADPDHTYTNAQVVDGIFNIRGAPLESRYNVALVSWNDPSDFYRQKVEYVEDKEGIASYGGINKIELVAFGCSSQGQAQRAGKWALLTNLMETDVVNFKLPLDGIFVRPGEIIKIADNDRGGRRIGGRITGSSANSVTVDKAGQVIPGDLVTVTVEGSPVTMTVKSFDAATATITFTTDFAGGAPRYMSPWAIESKDLGLTEWRVTAISDNGDTTFSVTASAHVRGKFDAIENGTVIEKTPITVIPPSVQQPVTRVSLTSDWAIDQTLAVTTMTISWEAVPNATKYEVQWRVNDKDWIYAGPAYGTEMDVVGIYAGVYEARVQAVNSIDVHSPWTRSNPTRLQGKTGEPPKVAFLRAKGITFGIGLEWGFLPGSSDTLRTEIEYAEGPNEAQALKLGDYAYPINTHTLMGLAAGKRFFFRARLVDRTGNIGAWSDWVDGMSSNQASDILEYLKGQITQTELGKELAAEIPKISGDVPGSVNERIKDAQDAVNVQINNINAQLAELAGAAEWVANKQYQANDIVKHNGGLWRANAANINSEPPSASWDKIGDYADVGEALAAMAVQLENLKTSVTKIDGNLVALTTKTDGIFAQINPPMAGSMGDYAGAVSVFAGVWSDRSARASEDSALSIRIDGVLSRVGDNEASVLRTTTALANRTEAIASDVNALNVKVEGNTAGLVNEARTRATADTALSEQIVSMSAEINSELNPKIDRIAANLQTESLVRADETGALARRSETLETNVGKNTASIQQTSTIVNKLNQDISASWSVKLQVNQYGQQQWAGFGLGIDGSSGQLESRFFIAANQFYIASSLEGGAVDVPFGVVNGQTFIRDVFIQNGSINMLKIGDNLQSDDYVPGKRGWKLGKGGNLEFNGTVEGGGRITMTNRSIRVYDGQGNKRVQLGDLTE